MITDHVTGSSWAVFHRVICRVQGALCSLHGKEYKRPDRYKIPRARSFNQMLCWLNVIKKSHTPFSTPAQDCTQWWLRSDVSPDIILFYPKTTRRTRRPWLPSLIKPWACCVGRAYRGGVAVWAPQTGCRRPRRSGCETAVQRDVRWGKKISCFLFSFKIYFDSGKCPGALCERVEGGGPSPRHWWSWRFWHVWKFWCNLMH